ncbi:MAG: hypothetical protein KJ818_05165, partial [Candidatus Omnitrophica bacterium]|nr:hypothetical protein [Candidatus Omnitrophota bacterium]
SGDAAGRETFAESRIGHFYIGIAGGVNLYGYCANDPINATDPFGLDTYYINYELFKSNPNPTRSPISHSYIAITDNGRVTDTYSWGNFGRSQWFHNNPTDMRVAQRAIDSGIGAVWRGGEDLDSAVSTEFGIRENDTTPYDVAFNNCKENAAELLRDAQIRLRQEQQNKKVCK